MTRRIAHTCDWMFGGCDHIATHRLVYQPLPGPTYETKGWVRDYCEQHAPQVLINGVGEFRETTAPAPDPNALRRTK